MQKIDLQDVDRTRAFTPDEQSYVDTLPREARLEYMRRPSNMPQAEVEKHYVSKNYPEVKYGPSWTLTPPKGKK